MPAHKILLIDDDSDFLEANVLVLEQNGFEVDTATTPESGLEKIGSVKPDLVVLDVMMPSGYEGFDVARKVREEMGLHSLPILLLTAIHERMKVPYRFAPDESHLPVDVFLDKPVMPDQLVQTIREMLGEAREEPEHPI
ncbi:MAG: response regulator [Deltaproteobacteria bacterium]|nr:response regulator [Deltaproteobacteria bacterium]